MRCGAGERRAPLRGLDGQSGLSWLGELDAGPEIPALSIRPLPACGLPYTKSIRGVRVYQLVRVKP